MNFYTVKNRYEVIWGCLGRIGKNWQFWPREALHKEECLNKVRSQLKLCLKVVMDSWDS